MKMFILSACFCLTSCLATYQVRPLAEEDTNKPTIVVATAGIFSGYNFNARVYENDVFVGRLSSHNRYLAWHPSSSKITIKVKKNPNTARRELYYTIYPTENKTYYLLISEKIGLFQNRLYLSNKKPKKDLKQLKKPMIHIIGVDTTP
jgi:hypothetical protein